MKCISEELIQKYIDGETSVKENVQIGEHLIVCKDCLHNINEAEVFAKNVKNAFNSLAEREVVIPEFKLHQAKTTQKRRLQKQMYYYISVASVILFALGILHFNKVDDKNELFFMHQFESEYDANLPVIDQEMVITLINPEGKTEEWFVE